MKKIYLLVFILFSNLFANNINIAVAANVSYAINDLIKEFNTLYPDIKVKTTLGSSGKLTVQIKNGAPYQLFMSANIKYPQALYNEHLAIVPPVVYAYGALACLSSKKRDFSNGIYIVKESYIKKIAIANPKTAPYGKATIEALKNVKVYKNIKDKLIFGESISQTLSYTMVASDIGFVAKSLLYSSKMSKYKKGVNWIEVDSKLYTPIKQGMVILANSKDNKDVKRFYEFILSGKAKEVFKRYGYILP